MSLQRSIEPEWLDTLPPDDPGAIGSRRDLRVLNDFMLQGRTMSRLLLRNSASAGQRRILDLGAGDGNFMLGVAKRLGSRWSGATVTLLDRQRTVSSETLGAFEGTGWKAQAATGDVLEFLDDPANDRFDIITVNLFLHHLAPAELDRLCRRAAEITQLFVACEPRRDRFGILGSRLVWVLGCNRVTRHDALASVRAGFNGRELSTFWPKSGHWDLQEHRAALFTHCFVARNGDQLVRK